MIQIRVLLLVLLLAPGLSRAELLVGIGFLNGVVGPNIEWAGRHTSYWVLPGAHLGNQGFQDDDWRWAVGLRHQLEGGTTVTNGFFTGLLLGDLGGEKRYRRLGIGAELGHQWVGNYVRLTTSAGLAILEPLDCGDYRPSNQCSSEAQRRRHDLDPEPQLTLGITLSLRR